MSFVERKNLADSLPFALQVVACEKEMIIDHDDLCAALGLPWLLCAAPLEGDISRWSMYARDAFLVEAGRVFGMHIREFHPPEAALGLDRAAEFDQHFDASYRPLIQRALEHGQPVLAWQGWPDDRALCWGVLRETCTDGIGFRGATFGTPAECVSLRATALVRPPTQMYVVERITPSRPEPDALLEAVLKHARVALHNDLAGRFGVITGPAAIDEWIARVHSVHPDSAARHAASLITDLRSGMRFLSRLAGFAPADRASLISILERESQEMVRALEAFVDPTTSPPGPNEGTARLHRVREAASRADEALARRARPRR